MAQTAPPQPLMQASLAGNGRRNHPNVPTHLESSRRCGEALLATPLLARHRTRPAHAAGLPVRPVTQQGRPPTTHHFPPQPTPPRLSKGLGRLLSVRLCCMVSECLWSEEWAFWVPADPPAGASVKRRALRRVGAFYAGFLHCPCFYIGDVVM